MPYKKLKFNVAWDLLSHLLGRGSLVLVSIIIARGLNASDFAAYSYFHITVSMLAAYAALGMGVTASRFFSEYGFVEDKQLPPLGLLWVSSVVAGLVFGGLVFMIPSSLLDSGLGIPKWLLSLGVISISLGVIPAAGVLGLEKYKEAVVISAVSAIMIVAGGIIAVSRSSLFIAMSMYIVANFIKVFGNTFIVFKEVGIDRLLIRKGVNGYGFLSIITMAGPMFLVTLLSSTGAWMIGRFILAGKSGEVEFALFSIGLQWYSLSLLFPGIISRVVLPRLVKMRLSMITAGARDKEKLVYVSSMAALLSAVFIAVIGLSFSPLLVTLYGGNYVDSRWLVAAFLIAAIPMAPANILGNAIITHNGQVPWLFMTICWFLFLGFISNVVLFRVDALGGAVALGTAAFVLTLMAIVFIRKREILLT